MQQSRVAPYSLLIVFALGVSINGQLVIKNGAPHVNTDNGIYIGSVKESRDGKMYYEFLGIRYANILERFQPAVAYNGESFNGIPYNATKSPPKCPQQFGSSVIGSLECLCLNVYVPKKPFPTNDGFPVIAYIHGGNFQFSSGESYEPNYFMSEGEIIFITLNYRLGALGFLSTEDDVVPGNNGLKDQILALEWTQKYIEKFGGNKKRVTIMGQNSGGASVHCLMLSPMAKGLFQSAIAQSGSVHNFWAFSHNPASAAHELGQLMKCNAKTSHELLKCLNSKSIQEIISAQAKIKRWYINPISPFGPTVEFHKDDSTFLSEYPKDIIERREFSRIPLLLGMTQDEGLTINSIGVLHNERLMHQLSTDFETIAPITFHYKDWFPRSNLKKVTQSIRKFYFGDAAIGHKLQQNLTNLYSDANFVYGMWKFALEHATENPVYPYILTFMDESSSSLTKLTTGLDEKIGVGHGDGIQYLFKSQLFAKEVPKDSEAEIFSKRLVKLLTSFAIHRKPTETWGSAKEWAPISKAQLNGDQPFKWYQLDKDTSIRENPFLERKIFWDKLFSKYSNEEYKDEL